ncbi:MAG: hypothetical protein R3C68_07100 [Myxococcota bacterium]
MLMHQRLNGQDEKLLSSIIEFSDTVIREIMVPRTNMVTIAVTSTLDEVRRRALDAGHSRIPVHGDTIDKGTPGTGRT